MTNAELNAAIAERCGVQQVKTKDGKFVAWAIPTDEDNDHWSRTPPDYCNDLNAMHEAEMILFETPTGWNDYAHYVHKLACNLAAKDFVDFEKRDSIVGYALHCPARQRAEAFAKTVGIWKETK